MSKRAIDTKLIHGSAKARRVHGAVVTPIFQTAMFEYAGEAIGHDLKYLRLNNSPNHLALHDKLAAIENAEASLVAASGMAAIATALSTFLGAGDRLLAQNVLYGGTRSFILEDLPKMGVGCDFFDGGDPASWPALLRPETKVIYAEAATNPTLRVADHRAIAAFARDHGLIAMIDNTFASPVNFRPLELGYDLSLHSATKYLNGHSDLIAGVIAGRLDLVQEATHKLNRWGGSLDPHACFLLDRGLKTLALRVHRQNETAVKLAQFLAAHPAVAKVNYPGLADHPDHRRAAELFDGFGGMLSFEVKGGPDAPERLIQACKLIIYTFSLGGVETLMIQPARTSHINMSPEERLEAGIPDNLIRVSVGLESADDLIADLSQAFDASAD